MISLIIILAVILLVTLFIVPSSRAEAKSLPRGEYKIISVEIESGDSLWSIAAEHYSAEFSSMKDYIDEIKRMNRLSSDKITAGNYLLIPYYEY